MLMVQLLVVQVITFIGLVFVLRKIMYSASVEEMGRLKALSEDNERISRDLEKKMDEAQVQYREIIEAAHHEAKQLKQQTEAHAQKMAEEMLAKARNESERLLHQAASARDQIYQEAEEGFHQKSMIEALGLLREVLSAEKLLLLHQGLTEDIIQSLEKTDFSSLRIDTDKGELISPVAVDPAVKEKISAILSAKTGRPVILEECIERDLVAGISIRFGSTVIDGSLADKIREASIRHKI